jgi:hypothetical protein
MRPLELCELRNLVILRSGPHLSPFLPESLDTGARLAFRLGKRFRGSHRLFNADLGDRSALGLRWLPMVKHGKGGPS